MLNIDFDIKQYIPVKNTLTSLFIQPYFVTLVDLDFGEKGIVLNHIAEKKFTQPLTGPPLSAAINQLLSEHQISDRTVSVLVDGSQLMVKQVSIPKMPEAEVVESLRWSERDAAPFDLETAYMDFDMVEEGPGEQDQDNILLVAAPKDYVDDILKTIRSTRLRLTGISIIPAALETLIQHSKTFNPEISVPFINMGAANTGIYIFKNNGLQFSRDIPVGGRSFVDHLLNPGEEAAKKFKLARHDALEIMEKVGIPLGEPQEVVYKEMTNADINELLDPVMDRFLTEVGRSIDYYKHLHRYEDINRAYMTGRPAKLKNLTKWLSDNLGVDFQVYNPFDDFVQIKRPELRTLIQHGHLHAISIGSALEQGNVINLLPANKRYSYERVIGLLNPLKKLVLAALVVFCLSVASKAALSFMDKRIDKYKAELEQLRQKNTQITILEKKVSVLEHQQQKIITERSAFPVLHGRDNQWEEMFRELSLIMPPNARLDSCKILLNNTISVLSNDGSTMFRQVELEGAIQGTGLQTIRALNDLLGGLEGSRFFKNVTFSKSQIGDLAKGGGGGREEPATVIPAELVPGQEPKEEDNLHHFVIYADLSA